MRSFPRLPRWAPLVGLLLVATLLACGGGGGGSPSPAGGDPTSPDFWRVARLGGEISPLLVNSSLAVGSNRVQFGLLDREQAPILGARVNVQFFYLGGGQPQPKGERETRFVSMQLSFVDESTGRLVELSPNGVYVTEFSFDAAGPWGAAISGTLSNGDPFGPLPYRFDVRERTLEPMVGDPAPPSDNLTLQDVSDIRELTTDLQPIPDLYRYTVAEALQTGRPLVIVFATPAFCESRVCGPVMEAIVHPLYQRYREQAIFIHIEPYQLKELREGVARIPVQAVKDWNLPSEPWTFVVNRNGRVAAKFEGIVSLEEVEAALKAVLGGQG